MKYIQSYYTDIGVKRKNNQDSLAIVKAETDYGEAVLAIVCDGMGGHSLGELASKYCVKSFCAWFKSSFPEVLYTGSDLKKLLQVEWTVLLKSMNSTLATYGDREGIKMGCTLTAFVFVQDQYYAIHVGDSRGYAIRDPLSQITDDHSYVADCVRKGLLSEESAKREKKNMLIESMGITHTVNPEFYSGAANENECFLLCSDGLWHCMENEEFARYLSGENISDNEQLHMHLNYLVELVKERGEKDNISCVAVIPKGDL